jgi:hypothetical protein
MAMPIGNLDDFREAVETDEPVPFWAVVLYAAGGEANQAVQAFVSSHRGDSAALTGEHCRTYVLDNGTDQPIERLAPEDVASIAEYLGADRTAIPGIVFFTEPAMQPEGLSVRLAELLPAGAAGADVAGVFNGLAEMVTAAASAAPDDRLPDLRRRLADRWPTQIVGGGLVEGGSVKMALTHIVGQIRDIAAT